MNPNRYQHVRVSSPTVTGWSEREEAVIAHIMATEKMLGRDTSEQPDVPANRAEAIRRMRRRGLDDDPYTITVSDLAFEGLVRAASGRRSDYEKRMLVAAEKSETPFKIAPEQKQVPTAIKPVLNASAISVTQTVVENKDLTDAEIVTEITSQMAGNAPSDRKRAGRPKAAKALTAAERMVIYRARLREDKRDLETDPLPSPAFTPQRARGTKITKPSRTVAPHLLDQKILEQNSLCIYCENEFASPVLVGGAVQFLKAVPDHFIPRAMRQNNSPENIVAACHICNGIKSDHIFDSIAETKTWLQSEWVRRGHLKQSPLEARVRLFGQTFDREAEPLRMVIAEHGTAAVPSHLHAEVTTLKSKVVEFSSLLSNFTQAA